MERTLTSCSQKCCAFIEPEVETCGALPLSDFFEPNSLIFSESNGAMPKGE